MRNKRLQPVALRSSLTLYALRITRSERAFSLTEVLIAVGILAVAMVFIAGLFPTAIYFSTVSTERTIAAAAADEAFAKIQLYGKVADFNSPTWPAAGGCVDFRTVWPVVSELEFSYPSNPDIAAEDVKYFWSALCRRLSADEKDRRVQVTIFISRKAGFNTKYYDPLGGMSSNWPVPVPINVTAAYGSDQLIINDEDRESFVNAGSTIIDGQTGAIYRVLRRDGGNLDPEVVVLDPQKPWLGGNGTVVFWAVPPPVGGGRYPCIAVYQKVVRFGNSIQ